MVNTKDRLELENLVRNQYNLKFQRNARKQTLAVGSSGSSHEYDLFEKEHVIGGITTSPWTNLTGTANTGGKDRVSAELLWLSVWDGNEDRVMIMTDADMAAKMFTMWHGCFFPVEISIFHCDLKTMEFNHQGILYPCRS